MIGAVGRKLIGKHDYVNLAVAIVDPRRSVGCRNTIYGGALDRLRANLAVLAAQTCEDRADIAVQIAIILRQRHLRTAALAIDAHRSGAIDHVKALRSGKGQAQIRVQETIPLNHALCRVITISQPINPA